MRHLWIALVLALVAASQCPAADSPAQTPETPQQRDARMKWWRDARFGMFIHWGPISIKGTEIGWSRGGDRRGYGSRGNEIPVDVYDNLYEQFNPTRFNAKEWVAIAKASGMRYMVFTSRHHDGFSMFDTKAGDYKITSPDSPFRRDVVKELADACHEAGLPFGVYYSPPDWHHPDAFTPNHARYIAYLSAQVRELLTNYGEISVLWFDGLGKPASAYGGDTLVPMARQLQPKIIINNRVGLPADFDTPEQTIGSFQIDRPWETCMTICNQWAWKPNDNMKSLSQCIRTLVQCAAGDGNLLFNVGPMPTGEIEPRQVQRLAEMGQWLQKYGATIYGTRGGPFKPNRGLASTRKGNTIYLHVMDWREPTITLPPISRQIKAATLLTGGPVDCKQTETGITLTIAPENRQPIDTIVQLDLDGSAMDIQPLAIASGSISAGKQASASNVFQKQIANYGPQMAVDDSPDTRWATDAGTHQAWLEVDLGSPKTFNAVAIQEEYNRVRSFELQYKDGDTWKTFRKGTRLGNFSARVEPVTARYVRLNILEATDGPTIWEFRLFNQPR